MEDSAALAGAIAAVLSAVATFAGIWIARRSQRSTDKQRDRERREEYLSQLQGWSADIYAEKDRMLEVARREAEARLAEQRADHEQDLERLRRDQARELQRLQAQTEARVVIAEARERYWHRAATGQLRPGEVPPPPAQGEGR